jgi:hypothetical protein
MKIRERFKAAVAGIRRRPIEPGPFPDHPAVSGRDAGVFLADADLRAFEDVKFYGQGADAANARREARIARSSTPTPTKSTSAPPPKKKAKRSKRERLEAKAEKLRAEIARLRGRK